MNNSQEIIYPRCKYDMDAIYISAEGYVYPCCWLGNHPYDRAYKEMHSDNLDKININKKKINDIIESVEFKQIELTWTGNDPFPPCILFCSKPITHNLEVYDGTNEVLIFSKNQLN